MCWGLMACKSELYDRDLFFLKTVFQLKCGWKKLFLDLLNSFEPGFQQKTVVTVCDNNTKQTLNIIVTGYKR